VDIFYFIFDDDTTICFGDQVQLQVNNNLQSLNTLFNWTPGNLLNDSTIANPVTLNTSTTTFTVFAYETNLGCVDSSEITVSVEDVLYPKFDYSSTLACEGLEVTFNNYTNNAGYMQWNFGDGETSSETNPTHIFAFNNSYTVTLSAGVNNNCTSDSSVVINVDSFEDLFDIKISNVLTPNGDGKNDFFEVQIPGKVNECTTITIFNRWGQEVYHSDNYSTKWDGRNPSGKPVPAGTYYYIVDVNGLNYKGSITILR
jgi:gliding motility-associated-like protein